MRFDIKTYMNDYWNFIASQEREEIRPFFAPNASIQWHCTNEKFTVDEFIRANCDYPGSWSGKVERLEQCDTTVVSVVRVWNDDSSFHVVSFFTITNGKIENLDEFWGDIGNPPQWRLDMKIGTSIT